MVFTDNQDPARGEKSTRSASFEIDKFSERSAKTRAPAVDGKGKKTEQLAWNR